MDFKEFFKRIFGTKLPIWAFGLECSVCQKSFGHPEDHYKFVTGVGTARLHEGKVPKL
jgi:hypothetical protein